MASNHDSGDCVPALPLRNKVGLLTTVIEPIMLVLLGTISLVDMLSRPTDIGGQIQVTLTVF